MPSIQTSIDRDISPDSVFFLSFESSSNINTTLFSSASASSFASDRLDHDHDHELELDSDSTITANANCLAGRDRGRDLDLDRSGSNKIPAVQNNNTNRFLCHKVDKVKVHLEDNDNNVVHYHRFDDEIHALDSARSSFSLALKECQERRSRSEAVARKLERRRPASLDLNNNSSNNSSSSNTSTVNVVSPSPRLVAMMKKTTTATTTRKSSNLLSPGTPNYRGVGNNIVNKGWSSERVAMPTNGNRRQVGAALLPLNNNGRGLPSKWEDAERWIFSPVAVDGGGGGGGSGRPSSCQQQQAVRRPKAKSGPLGASGVTYYSMYSPALPMYEGSNMGRNVGESPFSAGVMVTDGWSFRAGEGGGRGFGNSVEPCIARSISVHGCTDLVCQGSLTSSQDEKNDDVKDSAISASRAVSRRDMATQMSPEGSCHSSPRRLSYTPSTPSILPIVEVQSYCSSKSDVRDVQIDERVTVTRWSKKHRGRAPAKRSEDVDEWKLKAIEPCSSAWEMSESVKSLSKSRREEAKIIAWENLQKAKAEAAIRKLEMKLEKKRSSSIDKIMKKLRSAQKKAQGMRKAVSVSQALQVSKPNNIAMSIRRTRPMGSLSGCFTCHAF